MISLAKQNSFRVEWLDEALELVKGVFAPMTVQEDIVKRFDWSSDSKPVNTTFYVSAEQDALAGASLKVFCNKKLVGTLRWNAFEKMRQSRQLGVAKKYLRRGSNTVVLQYEVGDAGHGGSRIKINALSSVTTLIGTRVPTLAVSESVVESTSEKAVGAVNAIGGNVKLIISLVIVGAIIFGALRAKARYGL
jgi:hypothetical protein